MAIDNRFDGLDRRIRELERDLRSIERTQSPTKVEVTAPKPESWLKLNAHRITPLIAILGFTFGTGAVVKFLAFSVDERIEAKTGTSNGAIHQLQVDFGKMSGKLDVLVDMEKARLQKLSELNPEDLKPKLLEVAEVLNAASALHVLVAADVKNALRRNLSLIDDRSPSFWPAAAAMVNYRSERALPKLPPCRLKDQAPAKLAADISAKATTIPFVLIPFENCEVVLDSPEAQERYLRVLGLFDIEFRNCRVVYRGGPLIFPVAAVPGRKTLSLVFKDCVFEMSAPGRPPRDGQQMVAALLTAEDPKAVKVAI